MTSDGPFLSSADRHGSQTTFRSDSRGRQEGFAASTERGKIGPAGRGFSIIFTEGMR
jgi:hypothetical protein